MLWKVEAEERLSRSIAQGEVEGMNLDAVRAQAAATLALVEATERLALAQETANDLAFNARIVDLPDKVRTALDPSVIARAVKAGQRAMEAMELW